MRCEKTTKMKKKKSNRKKEKEKYFWKQFKHFFLCKHQRQVNLCWHNFSHSFFIFLIFAFLMLLLFAACFVTLMYMSEWVRVPTKKIYIFWRGEVVWLTRWRRREERQQNDEFYLLLKFHKCLEWREYFLMLSFFFAQVEKYLKFLEHVQLATTSR